MAARTVVALFLLAGVAHGAQVSARVTSRQNPVRKVVQMLQAMAKKVAQEGELEEELFNKFMCYCKTGTQALEDSIENAETKIPEITSQLKAAEGELKETQEGLKQDQADRAAAKEAIEEATSLREKENKDYVQAKDDFVANIRAVRQATVAIEKGMGAAFLQTTQGSRVLSLVKESKTMLEEDRQQVLSLLSGNPFSQGYSAQGGQIVGILKQMGDSMSTNLADAMKAEEKSVHVFHKLVKAKTAEVDALSEAIETKTTKIGELGVFIVNAKDDIDDLSEGLEEDKKFLAELEKGCKTKDAEWEKRKKTRSAEMQALAETIKILNNDDALELFKQTLPAPGASFMQVQVTAKSLRQRASALLKKVRAKAPRQNRAKLDTILLSLSGKKADFSKVISMIDGMLKMLAEEQKDDERKKSYCEKQFDEADDKKKELEHEMETQTNNAEKAKAAIEVLGEEIEALIKGIKDLDQQVAEATKQRQDENAEYKDLIAADTAAKELLEIAKNRLNKFYNPALYKAPAKEELDGQSAIVRDMGNPDDIVTTTQPGGIANTGVTVFVQVKSSSGVAPEPPPETWEAYSKKGEESSGVIQMINLLIKDVKLEMAQADVEEKNAQEEYEQLMADSADKRAADSKTLADKEQEKADTEVALQKFKEAQLAAFKELQTTVEYIGSLHAECDWLIQFFDVRVEARAGEMDALKNAKAVLSGADYSLLETSSRHSLLRR